MNRVGGSLARTSAETATADVPRTGSGAQNNTNASRTGSSVNLRCGDPVYIPAQELRGTLRYLGPIDGKQGTWAGVELDEIGKGKNDGTVAGKVYFACPSNTGLFLVPSKVESLVNRTSGPDGIGGGEAAIPSISSVLSTATAEVSANQAGRQLGLGSRTTRIATTPSGPQRVQTRPPGRSRIASDTQSLSGLPPVAGGGSNNSSNSGISSPASNRRKTLTRIAPMAPATPAFEMGTPLSRPPRVPPATLSRGAGRPRPISTAGSVTSNRTASPPLSRPSSRLLAPPAVESLAAVSGTPRMSSVSRSNTQTSGEAHGTPSSSAPLTRRRLGAGVPTRPPEIAGRAPGASSRAKTANTADPTDRLRLRIDMLEAENRVLRLKSEQDKAHLAASQMLARDLTGTNGPMSPQARVGSETAGRTAQRNMVASETSTSVIQADNSAVSAIEQQLVEVQGKLESERLSSQAQIAELQSQISKLLESASQDNDTSGELVTDLSDVIASEEDKSRIADLESQLAQSVKEHAQELSRIQNEQSELNRTLEQRTVEADALRSDIITKDGELASLGARLDKATSDLARVTKRYDDSVAEQEQKQIDSAYQDSELVASLRKQIDNLRHDHAEALEQQRQSTESLSAAQAAQLDAESKLHNAHRDLEQLRENMGDYEEQQSRALQYRESLCEVVVQVQQLISDETSDAISVESLKSLEAAGLTSLVSDIAQRLASWADRLSNDLNAKAQRISELEKELDDAKQAHSQLPDGERRVSENGDIPESAKDTQARIEELEMLNEQLIEERNRYFEEQVIVNDYLEKLESESNRLVEDIEQLTSENHRLTEELRVASLHNSTVSLDFAAIDSKLASELAESENGDIGDSGDARDSTTKQTVAAAADIDALQQKHQREISMMQSRLADLEQRKSSEIKKLQDELGSLEEIVEDRVFRESELSDKIASLTDEVDRLQREIKHLRTSGSKNVQDSGYGLSKDATATAVSNKSNSQVDNVDSLSANMNRSSISKDSANDDDEDSEAMYCGVCDLRTHNITDCPEMVSSSTLFKQESTIDSTRPYCDNCELFNDHWTEDCPHGDEMF
ncbi:hypothetical protein IW150_000533 [Coemansia sp. RSA 2607]|nr:hypothetical protein IW150_000533 [Coemansia sp. RSA 2607]